MPLVNLSIKLVHTECDGGPSRALIRDHYFESSTLVKLCELDEQLIDSYVATGEPLNKAGAYGIQGIGACLVQYVNGEYANVVGLPLNQVFKHVENFLDDIHRCNYNNTL